MGPRRFCPRLDGQPFAAQALRPKTHRHRIGRSGELFSRFLDLVVDDFSRFLGCLGRGVENGIVAASFSPSSSYTVTKYLNAHRNFKTWRPAPAPSPTFAPSLY